MFHGENTRPINSAPKRRQSEIVEPWGMDKPE
jgi:hypothetical protein